MRIGDLITTGAKYYPEKLATVYKNVRYTYKELNDRVNLIGNAILNAGIKKEDRVGIICHTSHFYQEIFLGLFDSSFDIFSQRFYRLRFNYGL